MKHFSIVSFVTGIASGALILLIVAGGLHVLHPAAPTVIAGGLTGGGQGGPNPARMAARLGMTTDDLQKELASGKTIQQIAQEHGVTLGAGGRRTGSGGGVTGSGSFRRSTGSGSVSSSSLSQ